MSYYPVLPQQNLMQSVPRFILVHSVFFKLCVMCQTQLVCSELEFHVFISAFYIKQKKIQHKIDLPAEVP